MSSRGDDEAAAGSQREVIAVLLLVMVAKVATDLVRCRCSHGAAPVTASWRRTGSQLSAVVRWCRTRTAASGFVAGGPDRAYVQGYGLSCHVSGSSRVASAKRKAFRQQGLTGRDLARSGRVDRLGEGPEIHGGALVMRGSTPSAVPRWSADSVMSTRACVLRMTERRRRRSRGRGVTDRDATVSRCGCARWLGREPPRRSGWLRVVVVAARGGMHARGRGRQRRPRREVDGSGERESWERRRLARAL